MARPEKPITEEGPVADLARALREVRARAGSPPYRDLAAEAHRSASVLADAASGERCPTWPVTESFAAACGADPESFRSLWSAAHEHDQAHRRPARRHSRPKLAKVTRLPNRGTGGRSGSPKPTDPRIARGPDPWSARTPAEYTHLLRALRAWGGNPGVKEVAKHQKPGDWVTRSTFYTALNPRSTGMPSLRIVRPLVRACGAALEEWEGAWKALILREFERINPPPVLPERLPPLAKPDQDGTVHALKRPAP
jgi:hypothetical protein